MPTNINVGKTIINHPFGNGLFIPPVYGDVGDVVLLFYPHYPYITRYRYN